MDDESRLNTCIAPKAAVRGTTSPSWDQPTESDDEVSIYVVEPFAMPPALFSRSCSAGLEVSPGRMRLFKPTTPRRFTTCPRCFAPVTQYPVDNRDFTTKNLSKLQPGTSTTPSRPIARSTVHHSVLGNRFEQCTVATNFAIRRSGQRLFRPDSTLRDSRSYSTIGQGQTALADEVPRDHGPQAVDQEREILIDSGSQAQSSQTNEMKKNKHAVKQRRTSRRRPIPQDLSPNQKKAAVGRKKQREQILNTYTREQGPERALAGVAHQVWSTKFDQLLEEDGRTPWLWAHDGSWLFELDSVTAMRKAWRGLSVKKQQKGWPLVMLSTIHSCPDKAGMVLDATLDPLPPGYAVSDTLYLVAKNLRLEQYKSLRERTAKADEVLELLAKIIETLPSGHVVLGQSTLGTLALKLPGEQARELYDILRRAGSDLHFNTRLHFASKFAGDASYKEMSFAILSGFAKEGIDLNQPKVASVITTLLHCQDVHDGWSKPTESFSSKNALELCMEQGFVPNIITLTALLDTLCHRGEVKEAARLALLFAESGVQLDAKACRTIFAGAKASLKPEDVWLALDVAKSSDISYIDVLNNILHTTYYFAEMETRDKRLRAPWVLPLFIPLTRIYAKRFDLGPLQEWLPDSLPMLLLGDDEEAAAKFRVKRNMQWDFEDTILPVADKFFSESESPRLQPDSTTLATMLRAYIKSLASPHEIVAFYQFFKLRLEESDDLVELIKEQGSLIHDTFIMAMMEQKGLTRQALQVFGDMLKDYSKTVNQAGGKKSAARHPAPNPHTFTILMRGLVAHKEHSLANQIMQIMREHGEEPNIVTWNTLIKGYAALQDISKTVETLQDLEAAGFKPDIFTFNAFGRLRNQDKALQMMEDIIDSNARKMFEASEFIED